MGFCPTGPHVFCQTRHVFCGAEKHLNVSPTVDPLPGVIRVEQELVCIGGIKSDLFQVKDELCQGCTSSPVLYITLTDKISVCRQEPEGVWFWDQQIKSLFFADDLVRQTPPANTYSMH